MIDIAFVVDHVQMNYLYTVINSIAANTESELFLHILTDQENVHPIQVQLKKLFPHLKSEVIAVEKEDQDLCKARLHLIKLQYLQNVYINYYKLFLSKYLNCDKCVYLDVDIVVQKDIKILYDQPISEQYPFAAPHIRPYKKDINQIMNIYYGTKDLLYPYFNDGFFVTSLEYWRKCNIPEIFRKLMDFALQHQIQLKDQDIFNIVFCKLCLPLDPTKYINGLGYRHILNELNFKNAVLLHYNGEKKPWNADALYPEYWRKYQVNPGAN